MSSWQETGHVCSCCGESDLHLVTDDGNVWCGRCHTLITEGYEQEGDV